MAEAKRSSVLVRSGGVGGVVVVVSGAGKEMSV